MKFVNNSVNWDNGVHASESSILLRIIIEGLDGGGVWFLLFIKNLAYYSSH